MDSFAVLTHILLERLVTPPLPAPRWEANDDTEDDNSNTEWMGHRGIVRRVTGYQGSDAEGCIKYHCRNEGKTGYDAEIVMDGVEEIGDGPEKQDDRDVQECVCPGHKLPHLELIQALK